MDNLIWRSRAKIVAILDLIFSSFSLLITIGFAVFTGAATVVVANKDQIKELQDVPDDAAVASMIILWVTVAVMAIVTALELWAAIKLLNATELGRDSMEAIRLCKTWRTVTIVFMVINFASIFMGHYISTVISTIIRVIFLYVVHQFMQEITGNNGPTYNHGVVNVGKV